MEWFTQQNKVNQFFIGITVIGVVVFMPVLCLCNLVLLLPKPQPAVVNDQPVAQPTETPVPTIEPTITPSPLTFERIKNKAMAMDGQERQQYLNSLGGSEIDFRGTLFFAQESDMENHQGDYMVFIVVENDGLQCFQIVIDTSDDRWLSLPRFEAIETSGRIVEAFVTGNTCRNGEGGDRLVLVLNSVELQ